MMSQVDNGGAFAGHQFASPGSSTGTPESFNYETKFIVLNFMSRNPRETTSPRSFTGTPQTSTSDSDHLFHGQKLFSKSLPPSPPKRQHYASRHSRLTDARLAYQRLSEDNIQYKHTKNGMVDKGTAIASNVNHYQTRPRVSEDNISHKYQRLHASFDEQSSLENSSSSIRKISRRRNPKTVSGNVQNVEENTANGGTDVDTGFPHEKSNSSDGEKAPSRSSMSASQYRQHSMTRMGSQLSGDYSYTSDADDEGEDTSCGSSLDLWGSSGRLVDLHQVLSRLPTVQSESEMENDTLINSTAFGSTVDDSAVVFDPEVPSRDNSQLDVRNRSSVTCNLSDIELEVDYGDYDDPAVSTSISLEASSSNTSAVKTLDRSKLRLDIQDTESWANSKAARYEAVAASLRSEIEEEMTSLESEVEEAIKKRTISSLHSPFLTPMTPQTQAAKVLARIGDEVMDQYEEQLEKSVAVLLRYSENLTYDTFRDIASNVVDQDLPGWRQVALLMVYGQKAAWRLVESGHQGIGDLVDYTSRLVADRAAEFIIKQGGWGAVMNSDSTSLSSQDEVSPIWAYEHVPLAQPVANGDVITNSGGTDIVSQPPAGRVVDMSLNNNSFGESQQPVTAVIPQIPAEVLEHLSSSSDEEIQQVESDILSPWYRWFVMPENLALLSCTVAVIGLSLLLSRSR